VSLYVLTVTGHLVAMVAWVGTMVAIPAILARGPAPAELAQRLRAPLRLLATPGLLLTWGFGIANAVQADAFDDTWLHVKLAFVLALSAVHGVMSGQLRRAATTGTAPALLRSLHWVVLALLLGAVLMAVWKPA
jgi:putative membrane protein